jgi:hypothetical protein
MAREERSEVVCHCGLHGVVLKFILDKFVCGVWPGLVFVELLAAAGTECAREYDTIHVTATGSGREIHLYQPDLIAETLVRAVLAIRTRTPLCHS